MNKQQILKADEIRRTYEIKAQEARNNYAKSIEMAYPEHTQRLWREMVEARAVSEAVAKTLLELLNAK